MQTFLPYQNFQKSVQCLDYKRLGKQRVEAKQIIDILSSDIQSRWRNHPAVKMWNGYENSLKSYYNYTIIEWVGRGYNNSMKLFSMTEETIPPWLTEEFCNAHRSNLLRKHPIYYSQFGWNVPNDLPYIWPVK